EQKIGEGEEEPSRRSVRLLCEVTEGDEGRMLELSLSPQDVQRLHALLGDCLTHPGYAESGNLTHPDSVLAARMRASRAVERPHRALVWMDHFTEN
ncbi:MAG TPA: hypothetical protein VLT59_02085, partial [Steroidobacteraceae bacterium]|nr:hypothetical protein [Steroidobacteraceae bacterium]